MRLNLSDKEYRALECESYSSIKHLLVDLKTFLYHKEHPFKGSPATLLGTAVHHYIQGNKHLVAVNKMSRRSKEDREKYAIWEKAHLETHPEAIVVPASFEEKIEAIISSYKASTRAQQVMDNVECEIAFMKEIDGVPIRGKLDIFTEKYRGDIKTTSGDVTAQGFAYDAYSRDYDLQAYLYQVLTDGIHLPYYFVVCGTTAPFDVKVYKASEKFLESGKTKLDKVLKLYTKYVINGEKFEEIQDEEI